MSPTLFEGLTQSGRASHWTQGWPTQWKACTLGQCLKQVIFLLSLDFTEVSCSHQCLSQACYNHERSQIEETSREDWLREPLRSTAGTLIAWHHNSSLLLNLTIMQSNESAYFFFMSVCLGFSARCYQKHPSKIITLTHIHPKVFNPNFCSWSWLVEINLNNPVPLSCLVVFSTKVVELRSNLTQRNLCLATGE